LDLNHLRIQVGDELGLPLLGVRIAKFRIVEEFSQPRPHRAFGIALGGEDGIGLGALAPYKIETRLVNLGRRHVRGGLLLQRKSVEGLAVR